jgi:hypothetical protein
MLEHDTVRDLGYVRRGVLDLPAREWIWGRRCRVDIAIGSGVCEGVTETRLCALSRERRGESWGGRRCTDSGTRWAALSESQPDVRAEVA